LTAVLGPENAAVFTVNVGEIIRTAFITLDYRHHDPGIRRRNRESDFSRQLRQTIAAFFPTAAAICALENPACVFAICCGNTVRETPRRAAASIKRRVNYFWIVRRH